MVWDWTCWTWTFEKNGCRVKSVKCGIFPVDIWAMARLGSFVSVKAPLQHFWKEAARTHGGFSDAWPLSTLSWFLPRFFDQVPLLTLHNSNRNREEQKQELKEVFDLCSECVLSLVSGCVNVARCRVGNREQPVGSNRGMMSMDQLLSTTLSSRRIVFGDSAINAGLCAICDFPRLQTYFT